jgi:hypothetical protein
MRNDEVRKCEATFPHPLLSLSRFQHYRSSMEAVSSLRFKDCVGDDVKMSLCEQSASRLASLGSKVTFN